VKFRLRMDHSYQVHLAQITQAHLNFVAMRASNFAADISGFLKMTLLPFTDDILWGNFKFEFNEDLSVLMDFGSKSVRDVLVPRDLDAR
jgi:hypothetical protein